jgi:hypothetical protein
MKKLMVLSLAVLFTGFVSVIAQEHEGKETKLPHHNKEMKEVRVDLKGVHRFDKMVEELDLTSEQKEELKALLKKQAEQRQTKRAEIRADQEKEREAMEAEIINIIGQEKFDQMKKMQKTEMQKSAKRIDTEKIKQLDGEKSARMIERRKLPEKK